jgi:hypothetical protein
MTAPDKPEDAPLRAEIQFFMDKVFQISLAYFALLVSTLAFSTSQVTDDAAKAAGMTTGSLIACALLLLNILYATLSGACLFAVLKRGLFALMERSRVSQTWRRWEVFVRDDSHSHGVINMRRIAWNIDNYYVTPIFIGVIVVSGFSYWYCFSAGSTSAIWVSSILIVLHIVPLAIIYYLGKLNTVCRRIARTP